MKSQLNPFNSHASYYRLSDSPPLSAFYRRHKLDGSPVLVGFATRQEVVETIEEIFQNPSDATLPFQSYEYLYDQIQFDQIGTQPSRS